MKKQEKARIKQAEKNGAIFLTYENSGVVLLLRRTGKDFGHISWACCSDNDIFKKRIGKTAALNRYCNGECLPIFWQEKTKLEWQVFLEDLAVKLN